MQQQGSEGQDGDRVGGALSDDTTTVPMVSVVVVHYNRPQLLEQALRSVANQTHPAARMEVVLVDDGSTTPEAVEYLDQLEAEGSWWSERGWRVLRQPNRYLGAARNAGWRAARGEWVLFMDDDNVAMPSLVRRHSWAVRSAASRWLGVGHISQCVCGGGGGRRAWRCER
jgi:glycosyltransferase involved in cell wall biosynthesis